VEEKIIKHFRKKLNRDYPNTKFMIGDFVKVRKNNQDIHHISNRGISYLWSGIDKHRKDKEGELGMVVDIDYIKDTNSPDKFGLYSAMVEFYGGYQISFTQEHLRKFRKQIK